MTPVGSGALALVSCGEPGAVITSVALAALPVPLLLELTCPVVLVTPGDTTAEVTLTEITQLAPTAIGPPPLKNICVSP